LTILFTSKTEPGVMDIVVSCTEQLINGYSF